MAVTEWKDSIVFLHSVEDGGGKPLLWCAGGAAGGHAKAGARARQAGLAQLENGAGPHGPLTLPTDMPLFCAPAKHMAEDAAPHPVLENSPRSIPIA